MVYKINVPLVSGDGTRKKDIIDANNDLTVDEIRAGTYTQLLGFQGTTSGYTTGGGAGSPTQPPPTTTVNTIDKFPFASDANATDVGDRTITATRMAGQSSDANGYTSGGRALSGPVFGYNVIDKFPFSSDANAADVGDMTYTKEFNRGQSSTSNGYNCGGTSPPGISMTNIIEKFPFSSDANAADVGDLSVTRYGGAGISSIENGYYASGSNPPAAGGSPPYNLIQRFSFASDGNSTTVGELTTNGSIHTSGKNSRTNGYVTGLYVPSAIGGIPSKIAQIDKFPFANETSSTFVGYLSTYPSPASGQSAGQSSDANGYTAGGHNYPPYTIGTTIDKFPFSSDANATDVGDLSQRRDDATGQQV